LVNNTYELVSQLIDLVLDAQLTHL
jgi:hypothetical protein